MLRFKKDGMLHKIAYGWGRRPRTQTSLCVLFWRTLLGLFIVWPFTFLAKVGFGALITVGIILGLILQVAGTPFAFFLFGARPVGALRWTYDDDADGPFKAVSRWPKVWGMRLLPGVILGGAGLLYLVCKAWIGALIDLYTDNVWGPGVVWGMTGLILAILVYVIVRKVEWWQMVVEFAKAKKDRICPMVKFE